MSSSPAFYSCVGDTHSTQYFKADTNRMDWMYPVKQPLNNDSKMPQIGIEKKENIVQSFFNAFTNMIGERVSRNTNTALSVTVVQNDGIIPYDFFKNLTSRKEIVMVENQYIHNMQSKDLNILEKVQDSMFDENNFHVIDPLDIHLMEFFDTNSRGVERETGTTLQSGPTKAPVQEKDLNNSLQHNVHVMENDFCNINLEDLDNVLTEDTKKMHVPKKNDCHLKPDESRRISKVEHTHLNKICFGQMGIPNLFNMLKRAINIVTKKLYMKNELSSSQIYLKRSHSPKQRRKMNSMSKGRRRGRGKSQLRRSGVSQTRHRKERSKHNLVVDIQADSETWQDYTVYHTIQGNTSLYSCNLDANELKEISTQEMTVPNRACRVPITLGDVMPKQQQPKVHDNTTEDMPKFSIKMRYVPELARDLNSFQHESNDENCILKRDVCRSRLVSDSSIDSEDSYCIVFEAGLESPYESDDNCDERSDEDESSEESESDVPTQKVKFNMKPIIHTMVQWDYAYRAARKGPWEQMARDRDRFKSRINCIGRVLNPILAAQHRNHVWEERFAVKE